MKWNSFEEFYESLGLDIEEDAQLSVLSFQSYTFYKRIENFPERVIDTHRMLLERFEEVLERLEEFSFQNLDKLVFRVKEIEILAEEKGFQFERSITELKLPRSREKMACLRCGKTPRNPV